MYRAGLEGMLDGNNIKAMNNFYTMNNTVQQCHKYVYVRKNEYRTNDRDNMRKDIRKFNVKSLLRTMPEEIKAAGLQTSFMTSIQSGMNVDPQRLMFINNMGFAYATQLEIKEYFVNQGVVQKILLDGRTLLMSKAINPETMYSAAGIVDSSNNSVNTINNPMFNPIFRAKMERIRNGDMTPEANEFYKNYLMQKQQQEMMNNMNWAQGPQAQQPYPGVWQNQVPTMTQGAFYMPQMPGMNNQ
jgi:hypothetical protein